MQHMKAGYSTDPRVLPAVQRERLNTRWTDESITNNKDNKIVDPTEAQNYLQNKKGRMYRLIHRTSRKKLQEFTGAKWVQFKKK